jgi:hypothetical protein
MAPDLQGAFSARWGCGAYAVTARVFGEKRPR